MTKIAKLQVKLKSGNKKFILNLKLSYSNLKIITKHYHNYTLYKKMPMAF